jgi:hypothetical protein
LSKVLLLQKICKILAKLDFILNPPSMKHFKQICFVFLSGLFLPNLLSAQICTGGGAPATVTLNLAGRVSYDDVNDPDNETGTLISSIVGDVVGFQSSGVNFTLVGASRCFHPQISFLNPALNGIIYTPSNINGTNCVNLPTSTFIALNTTTPTPLTFPTGPGGEIIWQLYEDINNGSSGNADANYTAGTITLYVCPTGQVLPIELKFFSGKAMEKSNLLNWATASEKNVAWQKTIRMRM